VQYVRSEVSKKVYYISVVQKLREEIDWHHDSLFSTISITFCIKCHYAEGRNIFIFVLRHKAECRGDDKYSRNRLFSAQDCILEASWSETSAQKLFVQSWTGPENFIKTPFNPSKVFQLLNMDRLTYRLTHTLLSIYMIDFLMPFLILFTSLCLLCSLH
jgi:hypothetical protein